jgi:hypothetical protein
MKAKVYKLLLAFAVPIISFNPSYPIEVLEYSNNIDTIVATRSNIIFEETFESRPFSSLILDHVGKWKYALQYVDSPVFEGKKAARFEIKDDQPLVKNGKRAEVVIIKGKDLPSNDMWYSFAVYFPAIGYGYDREREIFSQWYQKGTPATSLRTKEDRFLLETGNTPNNRKQIDLGAIEKDSWHEFVLHFIHSYDSSGLIEIWHNGTKVLINHGGNMYNNVLPKWKLGPYKASFKHGTSMVKRRIIYIDNIRVGNSKATFGDMTSEL